jgi:transcriptional regulator with XRE-family HTH domain
MKGTHDRMSGGDRRKGGPMRGSVLSRKLRVLRAEQGLTIGEASKEAGVSADTLGLIERGKRAPQVSTLRKLGEIYGVSLDELLQAADEQEGPVLLGKAEAPVTGRSQTSTRSAEESEQALARVLEPARAEALRDQQAVNRFFASEGIERDYSGPIAEAEGWKRFLDEFSPEERPGAFSAVLLGYARLEQANVNLEANFTRLRKLLRERDEQTAQRDEKIAQLEEKVAKLEKRLRERNEQMHAQLRAEAERQGVRD